MVFKKPYAFLIKHFRLIHLVITAILVYIVSFSNKIYTFINSCIADYVNRYNALEYINYNIYIFIGIGIVLFSIIYWLLKYKDKPTIIYVVSIFGYLVVSIYLFVLYGYFSELPNNIIDLKTIRAYRDIMLIVLCFEYFITIIMFIRGLGFDVKKFNFSRDIQELNLTHEDAEEIEVDVNVDTNVLMREVRKQKREFGYFFKEYRVIIFGILSILVIILGVFCYNYFSKKYKVYSENEYIGYINNVNIKSSYYNIGENKNYVIVSFDIFKNGLEDRLNVNNMILSVGDDEYIPNKNICYNFDFLGNCYKKQYVNNNVKNYIIVYEVDSLNIEKSYLIYKESYDDSFKVKLNLKNYE